MPMARDSNRKKLTAIFFLAFASLAAMLAAFANIPPIHAQTAATATAPYAAAKSAADAQGKQWVARGIPGVALAVAVHGTLVYSETFGYADLEERIPVWPTTKFRIGSVSKPLTAAALVRLVEQNKIDLDAPIQKYVPTFPDKGAPITIRMLAGHLAGIRHYKDHEELSAKHYNTVLDGLQIFQNDPLVAPPGTKFSYSSYGFNLLSAAIEKACGEAFPRCMQDLVIAPLGLTHTAIDQPAEIIEQRARFYEHEEGHALENAPFVDNSYKWAGGGYLSTAEDLAHFGSAFLQPGYVSEKSLALLFTPQKTSDGKATGYGMGWGIGTSHGGQRIFEHSGGSVGGTSDLIVYPDSGVVIAMVCNFDGPKAEMWTAGEVQKVAEAFIASH
jgi:CubicO group peptidase (beta-lactamase class C family)